MIREINKINEIEEIIKIDNSNFLFCSIIGLCLGAIGSFIQTYLMFMGIIIFLLGIISYIDIRYWHTKLMIIKYSKR